MKRILAIDPGTTESAFLVWEGGRVTYSGMRSNEQLRYDLQTDGALMELDECAIEMVASYGMPVGREVFETCVWIGRFIECCQVKPILVYRKDVKNHLCGTYKAKDGNIRQALIDKLGAPGTKMKPGPTYGVTGHLWAALAVACYAAEKSPEPDLFK